MRLERVEEEMVGKYGKEWRIYIIFTEWESDEPERCAKGCIHVLCVSEILVLLR